MVNQKISKNISLLNQRTLALIILAFLLLQYFFIFGAVKEYREKIKKEEEILYLPPPELVQLISLDYKNMVSELLFIRSLIYYGERIEKHKKPNWHWFYKLADNSALLDPYNIDTYWFTNAILTWEGGMVKETNAILERGFKYRKWDWYIPWFLGTNYAYFLKDNSIAADWYAEAAKLNPGLTPSAINYYLKSDRLNIGLDFLSKLYEETTNKDLKESLGKNLLILQQVYFLQEEIKKYNAQPGKQLQHLQDLISDGLIKEIPKNPFVYFFWDKEKNTISFIGKE